MKHQYLEVLAASLLLCVNSSPLEKRFEYSRPPGPYPLDVVDELGLASIKNFEEYLAKNPSENGCSLETAVRRKEWSDLSVEQREDYVAAVLCLQSKPSQAPKDRFPGALSRYDDFVPNLLPAHRYYIWFYEQALRKECGYEGYQPYWNYDRYAADPINSPLFNGNMSSMGGNGLPSDYAGVPTPSFAPPLDVIPNAGGGGCVTEGPFKDLGPKSTFFDDIPPNPQADGYGSNPRCLRRDVNKYAAAFTTANWTYALITENQDIDTFQQVMLGTPAKNDWGVHLAGHYTIGGDPGGDFWASPGDPVFYFHHGMIDRIWWLWQMQDPDNRMMAVAGTQSVDHSVEDVVDLAWLAPAVPVADLLNNIGGHGGRFCFIYD
ncbi:hypothetical protein DL764_007890 [Monosporascus ibericus]|uniref:Tyrosinase copper-binding domain-containing protein n=1 Tax=Monosporascus ibericus TaxID=155417 RepID=A0A4Q4T1Z3_9PEZI|nr:hypothetical protein DL764_007890 [Monosporascus ibericus]